MEKYDKDEGIPGVTPFGGEHDEKQEIPGVTPFGDKDVEQDESVEDSVEDQDEK